MILEKSFLISSHQYFIRYALFKITLRLPSQALCNISLTWWQFLVRIRIFSSFSGPAVRRETSDVASVLMVRVLRGFVFDLKQLQALLPPEEVNRNVREASGKRIHKGRHANPEVRSRAMRIFFFLPDKCVWSRKQAHDTKWKMRPRFLSDGSRDCDCRSGWVESSRALIDFHTQATCAFAHGGDIFKNIYASRKSDFDLAI